MTEKEIFKHLIDIGCCNICSLRHLGCTVKKYYINFDLSPYKENVINDDIETKKQKKNVCIACIGLLQDEFIDKLLENIETNTDITKYDSASFACALSLPIAPQLRCFSLNQHLKEKFGFYYDSDSIKEVPLKEVWKWILSPKINEKLNKQLDTGANSDFLITMNLRYVDEDKELKVLLDVSPETFKKRTNFKKYRGEIFTRKCVEDLLTEMDLEAFKKFAVCPPSVPDYSINVSNIFCTHNSIYLAGRYNKYSRNLSQTPWVINGKRMSESSVQEIICEPLCKQFDFKIAEMKFASSGREDCDVRCLGDGRPFALEIINPKRTLISFEEFRLLENSINESLLVQVKDLQLVSRDELNILKQGEESKTKVYQALCVSQAPIGQDNLEKLSDLKDVVLQQKTPVRVLHRRPLATRARTVHNLKANLLNGHTNMFTLDLETQAGTYVKEFVHGDFGRTKPSLSSILGVDVDIIALDVTAISLDWPKRTKELKSI